MFGRKRKRPDRPFLHSDACPIFEADPGVEIQWSDLGNGHWQAVCVCGTQDYYEPAPARTRLDPLDPTKSKHLGQCELKDVTDPAVLRMALKVKPGAADDSYVWVECSRCEVGWQVPIFG
jgi:hypothetical protein